MFRARQLAAASVAGGDDTGWFEKLYAEGEAGNAVVPWVLGEPNESLVEWAAGPDGTRRLDGRGKRALVVGCGTGDDAEFLAGLGFAVTGFDGMLAYATSKGWSSEDGARVRAHIVRS